MGTGKWGVPSGLCGSWASLPEAAPADCVPSPVGSGSHRNPGQVQRPGTAKIDALSMISGGARDASAGGQCLLIVGVVFDVGVCAPRSSWEAEVILRDWEVANFVSTTFGERGKETPSVGRRVVAPRRVAHDRTKSRKVLDALRGGGG
ncbi:hypothetical protein LZ32DRAFT_339391 [Colletotrichum eremochloae]|nr:hypothetical protein LZ32DRAFT_339391 [Colletotrichum eremochloae]